MKKVLSIVLMLMLCALPVFAEEAAEDIEVTPEIMLEKCGFTIEPAPNSTDVKYDVIELPEAEYPIGEVQFTYNGIVCTYRAQASNEVTPMDISGLTREWTEYLDGEVSGHFAMINNCADASVITWFDDVVGINYSLSTNTQVKTEALMKMANGLYVPLQGEAEGDAE